MSQELNRMEPRGISKPRICFCMSDLIMSHDYQEHNLGSISHHPERDLRALFTRGTWNTYIASCRSEVPEP